VAAAAISSASAAVNATGLSSSRCFPARAARSASDRHRVHVGDQRVRVGVRLSAILLGECGGLVRVPAPDTGELDVTVGRQARRMRLTRPRSRAEKSESHDHTPGES
jgi:hypothetical protein